MKNTRVHHVEERWDGTVLSVAGPKTVRVRSDGGFVGDYALDEFNLFPDQMVPMVKIIATPGELLEEVRRILFLFQPDAVKTIREWSNQHTVPARLKIDPRVVDASLICFLNYIGVHFGVDYAINTSDLPSPGLLEKMARAADASPIKKKKKKDETPVRPHGPPITPESRREALERGARERDALLNRRGKTYGY